MQYQKKWYTISEAAKYLGVSADTLRRWEKAKKIPAPTRTAGQARRYTKELLDGILNSGKDESQEEKPSVVKANSSMPAGNKKQIIFIVVAVVVTLAVLLPIVFFLL